MPGSSPGTRSTRGRSPVLPLAVHPAPRAPCGWSQGNPGCATVVWPHRCCRNAARSPALAGGFGALLPRCVPDCRHGRMVARHGRTLQANTGVVARRQAGPRTGASDPGAGGHPRAAHACGVDRFTTRGRYTIGSRGRRVATQRRTTATATSGAARTGGMDAPGTTTRLEASTYQVSMSSTGSARLSGGGWSDAASAGTGG
jgi:hypothetical protein